MYSTFIANLFLLFSIPLFLTIIVTLFFKEYSRVSQYRKAFFIGMFVFFVAQVFLFLIELFYKVSYGKIYLFIYIWITDILVLLIVMSVGYFWVVKNGLIRQGSYNEYPLVFPYTAGFMILIGFAEIVDGFLKFDGYILFLYPFTYILLIVAFSIVSIEAKMKQGCLKILIYTLLFPLSLLLTFIPWSYYTNYSLVTFGVPLFIGICLFLYLLKKDYVKNVFISI